MIDTRPKALVTGASSGIGAATAIELAKRGFAVIVHYFNNVKGGLETVEAIQRAGGVAHGIKADVRHLAEVEKLVNEAVASHGGIDVLVNNAGSMVGRVHFLEMTEEYWNEVFRLNVNSVFYCSQLVAKEMAKQKKGIIINVSSIAARHGGGNGAIAYAACKRGRSNPDQRDGKGACPVRNSRQWRESRCDPNSFPRTIQHRGADAADG